QGVRKRNSVDVFFGPYLDRRRHLVEALKYNFLNSHGGIVRRATLNAQRSGALSLTLGANTSSLSGKFSEVVQFRTTNLTDCGNFDFLDPWAVYREHALDAYGVGDLTNGERFLKA